MQNFELMNMAGPTGPSAAAAANAEVAEIMSIPNFEQLESPFFEEEVVDALREVTRHVNSNSTYEQIQGYLDEFDRQYGIIFRDDSQGRGLVFPQYIEHGGVRLGLEALKQAIAVINARVVTSSRFHSDWEGATTTPRTRTPLSSKIIDKYNKYKPAYDKQMSDDARFGVDGRGSRRGGNTRKKISNDKKDIHSGGYGYGVKIKIKHINGEEVEECFDKNHNKLHNYTITPFNNYQM